MVSGSEEQASFPTQVLIQMIDTRERHPERHLQRERNLRKQVKVIAQLFALVTAQSDLHDFILAKEKSIQKKKEGLSRFYRLLELAKKLFCTVSSWQRGKRGKWGTNLESLKFMRTSLNRFVRIPSYSITYTRSYSFKLSLMSSISRAFASFVFLSAPPRCTVKIRKREG